MKKDFENSLFLVWKGLKLCVLSLVLLSDLHSMSVERATSKHKTFLQHLYNICTMLDQRRRRWADDIQMLYVCWVGPSSLGQSHASAYRMLVGGYLLWKMGGYDMAWHGMAWHGMAWHDMAVVQSGCETRKLWCRQTSLVLARYHFKHFSISRYHIEVSPSWEILLFTKFICCL